MKTTAVPKFIDDPAHVVDAAVDGLCMLNPNVQRIANTNVVVAKHIADPSKVLLVCGGGSGHEPAHAGFVARGWLSAAVCGSVFASPPTAHVSAAIDHLASLQGPDGRGILVIIKNYAGDILNFEFAVRQAQAKGIRVETVLAADDAIFGVRETGKRRGVAGCCLLYKVLGAAAAHGASLEALKALAERTSAHMRTVGVSLSSCALPGCPPSSVVPEGMVEVGLGIHGEKGLVQQPYTGAAPLARQLVRTLLQPSEADEPLAAGSHAVLLLNNLGATTNLEMQLMCRHVLHELTEAKVRVGAVNVGRYMTSLDMHGLSLTLLTMTNEEDMCYVLNTDGMQEALMPFCVPQLHPEAIAGPLTALQIAEQEEEENTKEEHHGKAASLAKGGLYRITEYVFRHLSESEARFNALDAEVGDGDLGSGVRRAAMDALELLPHLPWEANVGRTFALLAKAVADACAGTSGPLYGALLLGAGTGAQRVLTEQKLSPQPHEDKAGEEQAHRELIVVRALRAAIVHGNEEVQRLGKAHAGDRTMVDVLEALSHDGAVSTATTVPQLLKACLEAGRRAAAAVAQMPAKFGRSRYMNGKEIGKQDPGAELIVYWIELIGQAIAK